MKFLFIMTHGAIYDLYQAMKQMDYDIDIFPENTPFHPQKKNSDLLEKLETFMHSMKADYRCLISYNFVPDLSDFCQSRNLIYISWTYDSPLTSFYTESIKNDCNLTFLMDSKEAQELQTLGGKHIYHLPMGVYLDRVGSLDITAEDERTYPCDISFVGSLYDNNFYNQLLPVFTEEVKGDLGLYLMSHTCKWDQPKEWPSLSPATTAFLQEKFPKVLQGDIWFPLSQYYGIAIVCRKLAEMDRLTVLNALNERYPVDLYTNSPTNDYVQSLRVHGSVNYYTEMNKIFYFSRINLNITLPSIRYGIPARIFDIMGCGGFVMSNYQPEMDQLFKAGENIETFKSLEELIDKTGYYLSHEEARSRLAINGYMNIRDHHTTQHRIKTMMETLQEVMGS